MLGRASHNIMFANSCNKFSNKWQLIRDSIFTQFSFLFLLSDFLILLFIFIITGCVVVGVFFRDGGGVVLVWDFFFFLN